MPKKKRHSAKTNAEKILLQKHIETLESEPTTYDEESEIDFDSTIKKAERDTKTAVEGRTRKPKVLAELKDHFQKNWPGWLITAIIIVFGFFMVDAKIRLAVVEEQINSLREDIKEMKKDIKDNSQVNYKQDININENKTKIEFLERNKN